MSESCGFAAMKQPGMAGNRPIQGIGRVAWRETFGGHNTAGPGTGRECGARHVAAADT